MIPNRRRRRLAQLVGGLVLYGVSDSMLLLAGLGVDPWDVLQQGLSRRLGLGVGTWSVIVGAVVLLLWVPLRQRPGVGTLANVAVIGSTVDLAMWAVPAPHGLVLRSATMLAGIALNGIATGAYIGAGLGPGPRDGLMTGLAARGHSIRVVRAAIELTVLASGWLLGGTVGIGTLAYAVAIGPLAHVFIPLLAISPFTDQQPVRTVGPLIPTGADSTGELRRGACGRWRCRGTGGVLLRPPRPRQRGARRGPTTDGESRDER